MVRTYKRKTERGNSSLEDYEKADREIESGKCSLRQAQDIIYKVNRMSLLQYINKKTKNSSGNQFKYNNPFHCLVLIFNMPYNII